MAEAAGGTYAFFDHAADVGLEVRAASLEALFRTAAHAVMEWTGPAPDRPAAPPVHVEIEASDREELLVRWLQELVVLFHIRRFYTTEVPELDVAPARLRARVEGRHWDEAG